MSSSSTRKTLFEMHKAQTVGFFAVWFLSSCIAQTNPDPLETSGQGQVYTAMETVPDDGFFAANEDECRSLCIQSAKNRSLQITISDTFFGDNRIFKTQITYSDPTKRQYVMQGECLRDENTSDWTKYHPVEIYQTSSGLKSYCYWKTPYDGGPSNGNTQIAVYIPTTVSADDSNRQYGQVGDQVIASVLSGTINDPGRFIGAATAQQQQMAYNDALNEGKAPVNPADVQYAQAMDKMKSLIDEVMIKTEGAVAVASASVPVDVAAVFRAAASATANTNSQQTSTGGVPAGTVIKITDTLTDTSRIYQVSLPANTAVGSASSTASAQPTTATSRATSLAEPVSPASQSAELSAAAAAALSTSTMMVSADWGLNLRSEPNAQSNVLVVMPLGCTVQLIDKCRSDGWCPVRFESYPTPSWCSGQWLQNTQPIETTLAGFSVGQDVVVMDSAWKGLRLRSGPTTSASTFELMPPRTKLRVLAIDNQGWLNVDHNGVRGFCHAAWVTPG